MRNLGLLLLAIILFVQCDKQEKPNIILIMSDDMGYSDIGCYGGEINTPSLDKLAANGLRFTRFYNTARCCPTRASLLTGLYAHQAGVGLMMNDRGVSGYRGDLNKQCVTIAEVLKTGGYNTYMVGKWNVTPYHPTDYTRDNWPKQRGFDKFYGTIAGAGSFYDPNGLVRENEFISPYNDPDYKPEVFYYTDAISDHATRYIRENNNDNPFFMYIAYTAPHWPMHALEKDIEKYSGKYNDGYEVIRNIRIAKMKELGILPDEWEISPLARKSWSEIENKEWEARGMEVYAAMIDNIDQGIGRIVGELERQNKLNNTLIMFLSDNGGCWEGFGRSEREPIYATIGPNDLQTKTIPDISRANLPVLMGQDIMPGGPESYIAYGLEWANVSNTPFRFFKSYSHEGGISTPFVVHWPDGIKQKNEWRHTPAHLIDIMATCVELGGVEYPGVYEGNSIIPMEGLSLIPVWENDELPDRMLFFEHLRGKAVIQNQWKLLAERKGGPSGLYDKNRINNGSWELYDMTADRTEMNNLIDKNPDKANELIEAWEEWAVRARVKPYPDKK